MNRLRLFIILIIGFSSLTNYAQDYSKQKKDFDHWKNDSVFKYASIGIFVMDAETGETILKTSPQKSMTPASILKIVTTATALEVLNPQYKFKTQINYSGKINKGKGLLDGNLIITGGGDPALGSKYFKEHYALFLDKWVKAIQQKGIKEISGDLIADASIYDQQSIPDTWIWEDIGNYYGAGVYGLSVYDNYYKIVLRSGEPETLTKVVKTIPQIPNLQLENQVTASIINRDQAYVFGSPLNNKRIIRGMIPAKRNKFTIKASIPNPPYLLVSQLKNKLEANGIRLYGKIKVSYQLCPADSIICQTLSPPLSEIINVTNHESVNLFAEHLCKHIAYLKTGLGSTDEGVKQIKKFWEKQGVDTNGLFMVDGSGLSHFNAATPKNICHILNYMNKSPNAEIFKESLPVAGKSGTLYVFNADNFPNKALRAKSGSMTRVRCYAGFLRTQSGKELIFTLMLNDFSCSQWTAIRRIEELLVELGDD